MRWKLFTSSSWVCCDVGTRNNGWLSVFPQQCPPLFRSFHFHSHWINEGEDKRGTLLKTEAGRLHPGRTSTFTYLAKSWMHQEKLLFFPSCFSFLSASLPPQIEYYSTLLHQFVVITYHCPDPYTSLLKVFLNNCVTSRQSRESKE